jgi:hypothetical protein
VHIKYDPCFDFLANEDEAKQFRLSYKCDLTQGDERVGVPRKGRAVPLAPVARNGLSACDLLMASEKTEQLFAHRVEPPTNVSPCCAQRTMNCV